MQLDLCQMNCCSDLSQGIARTKMHAAPHILQARLAVVPRRERLKRGTCQHPAEQPRIHLAGASSMLWHRFPSHPICSAMARQVWLWPCFGPARACAISCSSVLRISAGDPRAIRLREKLSTLARRLHLPARARALSYRTVHDCRVRPCHSISLPTSSRKKLHRCASVLHGIRGLSCHGRSLAIGGFDTAAADSACVALSSQAQARSFAAR